MSFAADRPATYMPLTAADGIRASAGRSPSKIALHEGERTLTYARLVDRVHRLGNAFTSGLGLRRGAHVGVLAPNCIEYVELVAGLSGAGLAVVTLNARSPAHELDAVARDAQIEALVVHPSLEEVGRALPLVKDGGGGSGGSGGAGERVVVLGEPYETLLTSASTTRPPIFPEEWEPMVIHYTSGTTGTPKGVLVSHRSRVVNYFAMAVEYGCYSPEDRALAIAPLYHGAGLSFALAPVFFGGSVRILPRFKPELVLDELVAFDATNCFMVPTHFQALFSLGEERVRAARTPSLRTIISNAAPLSQPMKEKIVGAFGETILFECYGSTEGGVVSNLRPADQLRKERSVGLPFPATEVRVIDEEGRLVAPGEVGELFSRSPYLFNGYWQRPEATAETMRDGWFSAGDLAHRDEEGYIYLVDRKGDKIISGGLNVYPREVEEALARHPAVAEAAVFGVPDERFGEAVHAAVVVRSGGSWDPDAVTAFCRDQLADYKAPRGFDLVQELPRNVAGKVLRRALRDPHWAGSERKI